MYINFKYHVEMSIKIYLSDKMTLFSEYVFRLFPNQLLNIWAVTGLEKTEIYTLQIMSFYRLVISPFYRTLYIEYFQEKTIFSSRSY